MRKIALLHGVRYVLNTFENQIRNAVHEELEIYNLLDEYLLTDYEARGEFSRDNLNRLYLDLKSAELTGAELIVVTGASLTPRLDQFRPLIKVPLIGIDDAMIQYVVSLGNKVTVMAVLKSAASAAREKLMIEAEKNGHRLIITNNISERAREAQLNGDTESFDSLIKKSALYIKNQDVVVLAQASMAHLEKEIQNICGCTVVSSPALCVAQIRNLLSAQESATCQIG